MRLQALYLRNLRNIEELALEFGPGMNEVIGPNGKGKTTLLEALFAAMTGASFRTNDLDELISHGKTGFFIECLFEKEGVVSKLQLTFDRKKKRVLLNDRPCATSLQLLGKILGVISTPEVQELVKGAPSERRFFLDLLLSATDPLALHHLSRMKRGLKQRNAALKMNDLSTISAWEEELATSMAVVAEKRHQVAVELSEFVVRFSERLLGERLDILYEIKTEKEKLRQYYIDEFQRRRPQELIMGTTLVGPHRDDLSIVRAGKRLSDFGSEGQMRLGALSLKLAEWHVMRARTQETPLFMIDDFAAFLDVDKRRELCEEMRALGQVFLTAHEPQASFEGSTVVKL